MHYVFTSMHLKALEHFTFYDFSTNVVSAENWFVCVSCYLASILALYMHKLCVARPFKYRCYVED